MAKVNLDALIIREDLEVPANEEQDTERKSEISISDLKADGYFGKILRKPDFQRETNEWEPEKICSLVESFLDKDLIPSVILWQNSGGYIYTIDGAHRMSALLAWINDDYGDKGISGGFYEGYMPHEQKITGEKTRKLINEKIGSFSEIMDLVGKKDSEVENKIKLARAINSITRSIPIQWIRGGVEKAEVSFFKINQQAAPLNNTELRLLRTRSKANSISTRAVLKCGTGNKYWAKFDIKQQEKIENLAKEVYDILFEPEYYKTTLTTIDLPVGGKIYQSQSRQLVLDFVNLVNKVKHSNELELPDDKNGNATEKYLLEARKILRRINSKHPSSLGLHPVVYFYSKDARHRSASFLAIASLLLDFEQKNEFPKFIKIRNKFEEILIKYDYLVQQIFKKYKYSSAGLPYVKLFYISLINLLSSADSDSNIDDIVKKVTQEEEFQYLKVGEKIESTKKSSISRVTKNTLAIEELLKKSLKCKICGARLHVNSISFDHKQRKEDGGAGNIENVQMAHPFCNSTIKN